MRVVLYLKPYFFSITERCFRSTKKNQIYTRLLAQIISCPCYTKTFHTIAWSQQIKTRTTGFNDTALASVAKKAAKCGYSCKIKY